MLEKFIYDLTFQVHNIAHVWCNATLAVCYTWAKAIPTQQHKSQAHYVHPIVNIQNCSRKNVTTGHTLIVPENLNVC